MNRPFSRRALSRRGLLQATSGLALSAGLSSALLCRADRAGGRTRLSPSAWADLARGLKGPLLRPGDAGFPAFAQPNNLRYAQEPGGIARCASVEDIQTALRWVRRNEVPLVARSGGHSYGGYSTTPGLIIDVSLMNQVSVHPEEPRVTVAGGVRGREVFEALERRGAAITHGRCPSVGLAGLVLGGGLGFNTRRHGLTCDQLLETQLVTADGELLTCNETENADLFWACRGAGGGNFGIHTSFTFRTFPVDRVTLFSLEWQSRPEEVLAALDTVLARAPDTLGANLSVGAVRAASGGTGQTVSLLGQFFGSPAELTELLAPAYAVSAPDPQKTRLQELPYWKAQELLSVEGKPGYYHQRSRFADGPLGARALATLMEWSQRWPGTSGSAAFTMMLTGGAMNRVAPEATAFVHRRSHLLCYIRFTWGAQDAPVLVQRSMDWLSGFDDAMRPFLSGSSYQNFIDPTLPEWERAYYGGNLERLMQIKSQVDPRNTFRFPQSIPARS